MTLTYSDIDLIYLSSDEDDTIPKMKIKEKPTLDIDSLLRCSRYPGSKSLSSHSPSLNSRQSSPSPSKFPPNKRPKASNESIFAAPTRSHYLKTEAVPDYYCRELDTDGSEEVQIIEVEENNSDTGGHDKIRILKVEENHSDVKDIDTIYLSSDEDDTIPKIKKKEKPTLDVHKSRYRYRSPGSNSPSSRSPSLNSRQSSRSPSKYSPNKRLKVASSNESLFEAPTRSHYLKAEAVPDYYCRDCQITLNSELTWKSHIFGQKHFKATKTRHLQKIAKGSIRIPSKPKFATLDKPRFGEPAAGRKRERVSAGKAYLQKIVDEMTDYPMPGLNHLSEIHHKKEKEITYYCEICDAPCDMVSVMKHLIGSRHQMNCLKYIDKEYYKKIKRDATQFSKKEVEKILFMDQGRYGKQKIKVFIEKPDKKAKLKPIEQLYFDRPGPSWRTDDDAMESEYEETSETSDTVASHDKYLDLSKADFCCKLCNSHMNSINMWAAHVRGQRHLKNALKIPGEGISKLKSIKSDADPTLHGLLRKKARFDVIVGLDYIRETRGPNGVMFNCFLCGAVSTHLDIVDHILLTKHRIKYLEKLQIDGKNSTISLIKELDIGVNSRESLIKDECRKMEERYGKGTVEVYISKNVY